MDKEAVDIMEKEVTPVLAGQQPGKKNSGTHKDDLKLQERKFVFLVNPVSGTARKEVILQDIETKSRALQLQYEVIPTNASGNYDFLKDKIAEQHVTDVVMIGGDGTVNQVVNALYSTKVRFGIIPLGSGNGLALAAGIPKKPQQAFEVILNGKSKKTDAFFINKQFSCMLSGLGFDAKVAHDFSTKASRGLLTYTQQSLINFFKAQPYQFEVLLDNFSFYTDAFFILMINSSKNSSLFFQAEDGIRDNRS